MAYLNNYYYQPTETPQTGPGIGGYMSAASGALQIGGDIYAANQAPNGIQTQSPGLQQMDEFGTPVYNLGGQASYLRGLDYKNYGRGLGIQGLSQGAAAGAAVGGVPGALIGGAVGLAAGLFGKRSARQKAKRKIRTARNNFRMAQQNFNEANISATQNRLGREQYNDMLSDPYGINGGYY